MTTTTRPVNDQANTLHMIRLSANSLSDQLYFLKEVLEKASGKGAAGPQLYPSALRGLCKLLSRMENQALHISDQACTLLGIPEGADIEEG